MRILITDASQRIALSLIQAYGRMGHSIYAAEMKHVQKPVGFSSRYVRKRIFLDSDRSPDDLLSVAQKVDVLVPVSINSLFTVAENREAFDAVTHVVLPPIKVLDEINNTASLVEKCQQVGIAAPKTKRVNTISEGLAAALDIGLPVVIKIASDRSTYFAPQERYRIVKNSLTLQSALKEILDLTGDAIVQEYVSGIGAGYHAVCSGGRVLLRCGHLRIREFPPSGGPSTCCVSFFHSAMAEAAEKLIAKFKYSGVLMVEFKYQQDKNRFVVMEVNPRFWGTVRIASYSGVDFPKAYLNLALGLTVKKQLMYRTGVKMRFLPLDLKTAWNGIRKGDWRLALSVFRDLFDFSIQPGLVSKNDLIPAFHLLVKPLMSKFCNEKL